MGLIKDAVGVVVSATITGGLFLGPAILGILFGMRPMDMLDVLAKPNRVAEADGAWITGPIELPGELDGNDPTAPELPEDVEAPEDVEPDPAPASDGPDDPDGTPGPTEGGADVVANPTSKAGTSAGTRLGTNPTARPTRRDATDRVQQAQSRKKCEPAYEGIRRRSDGTYEIARSLVNYHTASVKQFNELGWSQPNEKGDGKGWYVSGFGCNDALWHGGLRRGDVVLTVNGKKTNNMMQVLLLYTKVKAQSAFEVEILRKGRPITLRYEIVKG